MKFENKIILKKTTEAEIEEILQIIYQAQAYLKSSGIDQWQNNYPNKESILQDIEMGYGYLLEENGNVIANASLSFDGEVTYQKIYHGEWKSSTDCSYGVIHRVAVKGEEKRRGTGSLLLKKLEEICQEKKIGSIRIDTHKKNQAMQSLLKKNGYEYCGIIYLLDGNERMAFEKII
jgi:Acetyltransferases